MSKEELKLLVKMRESMTFEEIAELLSQKAGTKINRGTVSHVLNGKRPSLAVRKGLGTYQKRVRSCVDWETEQERQELNRILKERNRTIKQVLEEWMDENRSSLEICG